MKSKLKILPEYRVANEYKRLKYYNNQEIV
jgi:hypothetical protein